MVLIEDASDNSFCGYDYELGKAYFRPIAYYFDSHTASIKLTYTSQISLTWTWMIYFRTIGLDLIRLQF